MCYILLDLDIIDNLMNISFSYVDINFVLEVLFLSRVVANRACGRGGCVV